MSLRYRLESFQGQPEFSNRLEQIVNATLRGLPASMQQFDQSRPACKPLAKTPARGLRPFRKQAPARSEKAFLH